MSIIPNFIQLLRIYNVKITVSEAIDAQKTFSFTEISYKKSKLKIALKACLIKHKKDFDAGDLIG